MQHRVAHFIEEHGMHATQRRKRVRWVGFTGLLSLMAIAAGCGGSGDDDTDGRAYWSVVAADFNGDGRIDVAGSYQRADNRPTKATWPCSSKTRQHPATSHRHGYIASATTHSR